MLHLEKANRMADVIFQAARHFHLPCKIAVRRLNRNLKKKIILKNTHLQRGHSFSTYAKFFRKTKIFYPLIRNVRMHIRG